MTLVRSIAVGTAVLIAIAAQTPPAAAAGMSSSPYRYGFPDAYGRSYNPTTYYNLASPRAGYLSQYTAKRWQAFGPYGPVNAWHNDLLGATAGLRYLEYPR